MIINKNKEKTLFLDLLKSNKTGIVKFYMDKCPACIAMANEWKHFKKKMLKINPRLPIISIERSVLEKLNFPAKNSINGFPTILEILPGGKKGHEFNKARTVHNLIKFAKFINKKNKTKKKRLLKGGQDVEGPPTPTAPPSSPNLEPSTPNTPNSVSSESSSISTVSSDDSSDDHSDTSSPVNSRENITKKSNGSIADKFNEHFITLKNKVFGIFSGGKKSKKYKRTNKRKSKRKTKRKSKRRR